MKKFFYALIFLFAFSPVINAFPTDKELLQPAAAYVFLDYLGGNSAPMTNLWQNVFLRGGEMSAGYAAPSKNTTFYFNTDIYKGSADFIGGGHIDGNFFDVDIGVNFFSLSEGGSVMQYFRVDLGGFRAAASYGGEKARFGGFRGGGVYQFYTRRFFAGASFFAATADSDDMSYAWEDNSYGKAYWLEGAFGINGAEGYNGWVLIPYASLGCGRVIIDEKVFPMNHVLDGFGFTQFKAAVKAQKKIEEDVQVFIELEGVKRNTKQKGVLSFGGFDSAPFARLNIGLSFLKYGEVFLSGSFGTVRQIGINLQIQGGIK